MENVNFTAEGIAAIGGLILMLVFAYFPKLRVWYGGLQGNVKSLIMLGLLAVVGVAVGLLSHFGVIPSDPVTWEKIVGIAVALLISNQPTYTIAPKAKDVIEAKIVRDSQ